MPVAADFDYLTTEYTQVNLKYWETYVFLVLIPLVFLAGKGIFAVFMRLHVDGFDLSKELVQEDNKAVCVALAGMQWAVGLVAYGALADQSGEDHATNLYTSVVWFIFGLLFLLAFMLVADKLTFRAVNIREEVKKGNVSAALVLASSFISGGIVSRFTCGGGDTNWANTVPSALLFFALCVVAFIIVDFIIIFFSQRFGDPFEALADDNHAAGVLLFCARISVAMIVTTPLNSSEELLAFAVWLVIAIVVLVVMDLLVTYLIVSKADSVAEFHSKSWGRSMVHGACLLAFAYAIASFIPNSCQYSRAIQGVPLKERLIKLTSTQALLQWPNIVYAVTIMLYLCLARFVFVIPQFIQEPMRNWKQVVTLFLAESNVRRSMRKKGVKKGRAANATAANIPATTDQPVALVRDAKDLPPPPNGSMNTIVREAPDRSLGGSADSFGSDVGGRELAKADSFDLSDAASGDFGMEESGAPLLGAQPSMVFGGDVPDTVRISPTRSVAFSGYIIGLGITLRACFSVTNGSVDVAYVAYTYFWIVVSFVMLFVGYYFQRFLIWGTKLDPTPRRNVAAGIVQASVFICVALQTGNNLTAFQQPGEFSLGADLLGALVYYAIQMSMVGAAGLAIQRITPYDDRKEVDSGNAAAAISNGGILIAVSILASAPATKTVELLAFVVFFIVTVAAMFASKILVVRYGCFGGRTVHEEVTENRNWGATLVEASVAISIATCYTTFLKEFCIPVVITSITITNSTNTTNTTGI